MRKYINHFNTKFKYGVIGYYIAILAYVTYSVIYDGVLFGLILYFVLEGIYGIIMFLTYLIEKYITKTYE
jgi:hypothetical protein